MRRRRENGHGCCWDPAWNLVVTVAAEETSGWVIMAEEFRTDLAWT
jgi:hypothetical protein